MKARRAKFPEIENVTFVSLGATFRYIQLGFNQYHMRHLLAVHFQRIVRKIPLFHRLQKCYRCAAQVIRSFVGLDMMHAAFIWDTNMGP